MMACIAKYTDATTIQKASGIEICFKSMKNVVIFIYYENSNFLIKKFILIFKPLLKRENTK
ncbi:MAG: hypothetical protein CSA39_02365 [Flavobacteriales bacterium]|nr:MAG: hypothetical protein CSA39_02365 [Flavobacteriales bacterium]